MRLFHAGAPLVDDFTALENRIATYRLFSVYPASWPKVSAQWLAGCEPRGRALAAWRRLEAAGSPILRAPAWPRALLLDSGAFTAWSRGEEVRLDDVLRRYAAFIELAAGRFEVLLINLDRIPGERGRTATPAEIAAAIRESDRNYRRLTAEFGPRVLAVFHQDEDDARLAEVVSMGGGYMCVSPRNDLGEIERVAWARRVHRQLAGQATHGLATTGNLMMRRVEWHSADSAAAVLHAKNGLVDICTSRGRLPHYLNYFASERTRRRKRHFANALRPTGVPEAAARYGFTLDDLAADWRARAVVNMGELTRYAAHLHSGFESSRA